MDERMELKEQVGKIRSGDYVEATFASTWGNQKHGHVVSGYALKSAPGARAMWLGNDVLSMDSEPHSSLQAIVYHRPAKVDPEIGEPITERTKLKDALAVVADFQTISQYDGDSGEWYSVNGSILKEKPPVTHRYSTEDIIARGDKVVYIPK